MVDTINKDKKLEQPCWECKLNNNLDVLFKKILSANLWILDDWGVTNMSRKIAEVIFDLLDRHIVILLP